MNNFDLSSLSIDELKSLRSQIANELNYRAELVMLQNKRLIQEGDRITVDHPKTAGKTFRVTSMRRTKASIESITNPREKYTLPISMMVLA